MSLPTHSYQIEWALSWPGTQTTYTYIVVCAWEIYENPPEIQYGWVGQVLLDLI